MCKSKQFATMPAAKEVRNEATKFAIEQINGKNNATRKLQ